MAKRLYRILFVACLMIGLAPLAGAALQIEVEQSDRRPLSSNQLLVTMTGDIERGDLAVLSTKLGAYPLSEIDEISFSITSPGGSLAEGLRIGRYIASLPPRTVANVGSYLQAKPRDCASACIFIYLGADFRYLAEEARIGVHQFYNTADNFTAAEALSQAQLLSGDIVEFIQEQRADPAVFTQMSRVPSASIQWVPHSQLRSMRVVTDNIYDETSEYQNYGGELGLSFFQIAYHGTNSLSMSCRNGRIIGIAILNEPEVSAFGGFKVYVHDQQYEVESVEIMERENAMTTVGFTIPASLHSRLAFADQIGANIIFPSGDMFFGFVQSVRDDKLNEFVTNCKERVPSPPTTSYIPAPSSQSPYLETLLNYDIPGNDLTRNGLRDITFEHCQEVCRLEPQCLAVSYVTTSRWCWPKGGVSVPIPLENRMSAIRRPGY